MTILLVCFFCWGRFMRRGVKPGLPANSSPCRLRPQWQPNNQHCVRSASDKSPGGISPPGAPKTVREPLDSHGSRCSTVGKRAAGFTSSTGSSCCQLASVGRWSRLNNAAPSVQLHYRAFVPTTSHSAPLLRIGTLVLAVLAACDFSLYIGAQVSSGTHIRNLILPSAVP